MWKKVAGQLTPSEVDALDISHFEGTSGPDKFYNPPDLPDPGEFTVYAETYENINSRKVESDALAIPLRVWIRPTVNNAPPQSAIDDGLVSWYDGKYVGVKGEPIYLMADGETKNGAPDETIIKYLWDFDNDWGTVELEQLAGKVVSHIWNSSNLSDKIRCKAVTNYGIQSEEKIFNLKIYDSLQVNPQGPYTGRPNKPVELQCSINQTAYPGATFDYQWRVNSAADTFTLKGSATRKEGYIELTPNQTEVNGQAEYANLQLGNKWSVSGEFRTGGGSGADAFYIYLYANGTPAGEGSAKGQYSINYDEWDNQIQLMYNGNTLDTAPQPGLDNSQWRRFEVICNQGIFKIYLDHRLRLEYNDSANYAARTANNLFGFGARTGGSNNYHRVRNMKWSAGQLVDTDSSGKAKYTWTVDGEHPIEAEAITTTAEGWVLIEIDTTTATIEAGKPTAMPGGPYRGGIKGGNFSPIQFNGNHPDFVEDEDIGHIDTWEWIFGQDRDTGTIWNPTCAFAQAGQYEVSLKVRSEYGKWSYPKEAQVEVIDGKVAGYVRAADLRTPVKEVRLTLTSSHVNKDVLAQIAASDEKLNTTGDGGLWTLTDDKGYYEFAHLPLGSYRIRASKGTGDNAHEFETGIIATELTLDGPNQLAIDFVDISVYPVGGRVVYSIRKNGQDVLVEGVKIKAQPVGAPSLIEALPSTKSLSATGVNYSMPLFAGKYFFLAEKSDHDIRIKEDVPNYDPNIQLVTIEDARTDIDFIDYTTYKLTVFVEDSGKYKIAGQEVIISGDNGQAQGLSDEADGKFAVTLNPGKYTVHVQGADPEEKEVDLTGGDNSVTLTIPVKIELSFSPRPKLFDVPDEFLEQFGLKPEDNPEGYMYYYPPEPRTHTYTVTATANGNPVTDFNLFVTDEVGMLTEDAPGEQELFVSGDEGEYIMTAGLPKKTTDDPPLAAPKKIKFRAEKKGYKESDPVSDTVTVLGEVAEGSAAKIVAVPIMNYLVLHDPPGDKSYSYLDDSMTIKGIITNVNIKIDGDKEIPVYPSPWIDSIKTSGGLDPNYPDLKDNGLIGYKNSDPTFGYFLAGAAIEAVSGSAMLVNGALAWAIRLAKLGVLAAKYATGGQAIPGIHFVQYEISPNRHLETPSGDALPDILGPGKGDIYYGEGWTLGLQTKHLMGIEFDTATQAWNLTTETIETYDILDRTNQYIYTIRDIENIISDLSKVVADLEENLTKEENTNGTGTAEYKKMTQEKEKLENSKTTWQKLLNENLAYIWNRDYLLQGKSFEDFKKEKGGNLDDNETLIFSAGPAFEYSRDISAIDLSKYSIDLLLNSKTYVKNETTIKTGFEMFGSGVTIKFDLGAEMSLDSSHHYGSEFESGQIAEQSAGFVLQDDDVGDNFACWVYEDPQWKTPIFFQDAGSISSDPWEPGTNKAVDFTMELLEEPTGTFDYHQGANYKVKLTYTGQRELESAGTVDFLMYDYLADEQDNPTVRFNGDPALYRVKLCKQTPVATVNVSIYPPEIDQGNSEEKQYTVTIITEEEADQHINRSLTLKPKFADLRAPRASIVAPYSGQRISPVLFPEEDPFDIEVTSSDMDLAKIQLQIRSKQPDGVWEPWRNLSGMVWEEANPDTSVVTLFEYPDRDPPRREFTFKWTENEIKMLGVGEYALQAVAADKAGNVDKGQPDVVFLVDEIKPSVLTSIPNYQDRESERIYRGELSVVFTDDMRATDFSDRTFYVMNLLENNEKVAGYVSLTARPCVRPSLCRLCRLSRTVSTGLRSRPMRK